MWYFHANENQNLSGAFALSFFYLSRSAIGHANNGSNIFNNISQMLEGDKFPFRKAVFVFIRRYGTNILDESSPLHDASFFLFVTNTVRSTDIFFLFTCLSLMRVERKNVNWSVYILSTLTIHTIICSYFSHSLPMYSLAKIIPIINRSQPKISQMRRKWWAKILI